MKIRTRMCISLDGCVTTPEGMPAQLALDDWSAEDFGFVEFQDECDAVLMGRTTLEPALSADAWPWADTPVFVLGSERPPGTPDEVVFDSDPSTLLAKLREAGDGRDVHLVGGPRTIEAFRAIGALDELGLIVLPVLIGDGLRLTPGIATEFALSPPAVRERPGGAVELLYGVA